MVHSSMKWAQDHRLVGLEGLVGLVQPLAEGGIIPD